jgi:hypothetical protein
VGEEGDLARVAGDAAIALDHPGDSAVKGVAQLAAACEPVDRGAEGVAGAAVFGRCGAHGVAVDRLVDRRPLQA